MSNLSDDAGYVLGILLGIAKDRRGPNAIKAPRPTSSVIVAIVQRQAGWTPRDNRLNAALNELKRAGKARFMKGTGWVPTGSESGSDSLLDDEDAGLGSLAKTLERVDAAREAAKTVGSVEITFSLTPSAARLLVKAYDLDHDNQVIRRAAEGPVKESDPDLMEEAEAVRGIVRMICGVAEEE